VTAGAQAQADAPASVPVTEAVDQSLSARHERASQAPTLGTYSYSPRARPGLGIAGDEASFRHHNGAAKVKVPGLAKE